MSNQDLPPILAFMKKFLSIHAIACSLFVLLQGCKLDSGPAILHDPDGGRELQIQGTLTDKGLLSIRIDGQEIIREPIVMTGNRPYAIVTGYYKSHPVVASCHLETAAVKAVWCEVSISSRASVELMLK